MSQQTETRPGSAGHPSPFCPQQENYTRCDGNAAVDRPSNLPCHETAWQHIDSLQNPYAADQHQEHAHYAQWNSHFLSPAVWFTHHRTLFRHTSRAIRHGLICRGRRNLVREPLLRRLDFIRLRQVSRHHVPRVLSEDAQPPSDKKKEQRPLAGAVRPGWSLYWKSRHCCNGFAILTAAPGDGWYMQMGLGAHPCPSHLRSLYTAVLRRRQRAGHALT